MATMQVTDRDILMFQKNLADAINSMSFNRIRIEQANCLAEEAVKRIDFQNSALNHKGVNWFARRIVNAYKA